MRKLVFPLLFVLLLASCKKEDSLAPVSSQTTEYFPLEIGNYWVYEHYDINPSGNESKKDLVDSIVISRDTTINGHQYFIYEGISHPSHPNWGIINILRDSSGYIVNNNGQIHFAQNFTDVLYTKAEVTGGDTLFTLSYKVEEVPNTVLVPAGEFEVLNYKGTLKELKLTSGFTDRHVDNFYAKDIGKILESYFYFSSPVVTEKRLVRYRVNSSL